MSENVWLVIQLCQKLINCGRNVTLVTNHPRHKTGMGAKKLPSHWHFGFARHFYQSVEKMSARIHWYGIFMADKKTIKHMDFFAHMEPHYICVLTCSASTIHNFANDYFRFHVLGFTDQNWSSLDRKILKISDQTGPGATKISWRVHRSLTSSEKSYPTTLLTHGVVWWMSRVNRNKTQYEFGLIYTCDTDKYQSVFCHVFFSEHMIKN